MSTLNTISLMYQKLCELKDEIECAAFQVHGEKVFWYKDVLLEQKTPAELNFQNAVTLLYKLYWEAGNEPDIKFLIKKFEVYALDQDKRLSGHFNFVRTLRNFFQHNVADPLSSNTNRMELECRNWFEKQGANSKPNNEHDWEKCLSNLLTEASDFLNALSKCIGNIEQDEILGSQYIQDWKFQRRRYFSANDIDNIICEIAGDMGKRDINIKNIRNKVMSNWNSLEKTLRYDEDRTTEIKRLIVQNILDAKKRYPLLPEDIINKFNIEAGSTEVANLLDKGADFYKGNRSLRREELLEKIQQYVESTRINAKLMVQPSALMSSGIRMSEFGNIYLFNFTSELQSHFEELLEKKKADILAPQEEAEYAGILELERIFTLINSQLAAQNKRCPTELEDLYDNEPDTL